MRSSLLLLLFLPSLLIGGEGYFSPIYRWSGGVLWGEIDKLKMPSFYNFTGLSFSSEKNFPFVGYSASFGKIKYSFWAGESYSSRSTRVTAAATVPQDGGFLSGERVEKGKEGTGRGEVGAKLGLVQGNVSPEVMIDYSYFSRSYLPSFELLPPWELDLPDPVTSAVLFREDGEEMGIEKTPVESGNLVVHNLTAGLGIFTEESLWMGIKFKWKRLKLSEKDQIAESGSNFEYISGPERYWSYDEYGVGLGSIFEGKNFRIQGDFSYLPGYDLSNSFDRWRYYYREEVPSSYGREYTIYDLTFEDNFSGRVGRGFLGEVILLVKSPVQGKFLFISGASLSYSRLRGNYRVEGGFTVDSHILHSTGETDVNPQANYLEKFYGVRNYDVEEFHEDFSFKLPVIFQGRFSDINFKVGYILSGEYRHSYIKRELASFTPLKIVRISGGTTYSENSNFLPQTEGKSVSYMFNHEDLFLGMIDYEVEGYFVRFWLSTDSETPFFIEAGMRL